MSPNRGFHFERQLQVYVAAAEKELPWLPYWQRWDFLWSRTFEKSGDQNPSGKTYLFRGKLLASQKAMIQSILRSPRQRKAELGQFLTPPPVAEFMASLFEPLPELVRILDAGAGAGALTEALVNRVCKGKGAVRAIEVTLYEIDSDILDVLSETMNKCRRSCARAKMGFSFVIHEADFIQKMSKALAGDLFGSMPPSFEAAIANPPYRKITADSAERHALRSVGIETSNLYAGFIALIHRLLVPGGQLVGITPRSFCNGPYFRPFREDFLHDLSLRRLHVFESRKAAFREDSVLQENIIFHAVKSRKQPSKIIVSNSSGECGDAVVESIFPFAEIVHTHDSEKFIHIPSNPSHAEAKKVLDRLNFSLASLGLNVSTGRVVEFRLKESLRQKPEKGAVPLVYPCHFNGGTIHWPKLEARKPNAILDNDETRQWLVPSGVYLLTKRFTSKEERRRLVACLFDPTETKADRLGFENHLNYFHSAGRGLDRNLAKGLFAFLNSTVVDQYFRRFSGHTQVNATDLRKLKYPSRDVLQAIGLEMKTLDLSQEALDKLLDKHLHAS
jgi:adenine-specific DNA-methyltransferase